MIAFVVQIVVVIVGGGIQAHCNLIHAEHVQFLCHHLVHQVDVNHFLVHLILLSFLCGVCEEHPHKTSESRVLYI